MGKNELILILKQLAGKAFDVEIKDCDKRMRMHEALSQARKDLKNKTFDSVKYSFLFELKNENEFKSLKEYREANGCGTDTIKGLRKLKAFVCNRSNDWRGEYIPIN